jgi:recombination protein RecA
MLKLLKNKVAPPFKSAQVEIRYGEGLSRISEVIDLGVEYDLIGKSGSWFSYNGEKIGQGKENVRLFLDNNPEIYDEIHEKLHEILRSGKE